MFPGFFSLHVCSISKIRAQWVSKHGGKLPAYSGSLSTYAFLERAREKSPKHPDLSDEILNMTDRAKQAYQLLAELNRDITSLAQAFPKPVQ